MLDYLNEIAEFGRGRLDSLRKNAPIGWVLLTVSFGLLVNVAVAERKRAKFPFDLDHFTKLVHADALAGLQFITLVHLKYSFLYCS